MAITNNMTFLIPFEVPKKPRLEKDWLGRVGFAHMRLELSGGTILVPA